VRCWVKILLEMTNNLLDFSVIEAYSSSGPQTNEFDNSCQALISKGRLIKMDPEVTLFP
jgi:hypothetical protein